MKRRGDSRREEKRQRAQEEAHRTPWPATWQQEKVHIERVEIEGATTQEIVLVWQS